MKSLYILPLALLVASCQTNSTRLPDQPLYANPLDGFKEMTTSLRANDKPKTESILGVRIAEILTGDPVSDRRDRENVIRLADQSIRVREVTSTSAWIDCGRENWTFPVPLVKEPSGLWHFDGRWGREEIRNRVIGRNELSTMATLRGLVSAQWQYHGMDPDKDGRKAYAERIISTDGQRNGLFWPQAKGVPASPVGPLAAQAAAEGYANLQSGQVPYHGYHFRVLHAQGKNAPGGKRGYYDSTGLLTGGFAILAWPAEHGRSGVMTFIVSDRGMVFQKDLGKATTRKVERIKEYDPDKSWSPADTIDATNPQ